MNFMIAFDSDFGDELPSSKAAKDFVISPNFETGMKVLESMALRAILVFIGLSIVGFSGNQLILGTIGSVTAIEVGVLSWAIAQ